MEKQNLLNPQLEQTVNKNQNNNHQPQNTYPHQSQSIELQSITQQQQQLQNQYQQPTNPITQQLYQGQQPQYLPQQQWQQQQHIPMGIPIQQQQQYQQQNMYPIQQQYQNQVIHSKQSQNLYCRNCQRVVPSVVSSNIGAGTLVTSLLIFAVGCVPCALIPFCHEDCQDIKHDCIMCGQNLGTKKFIFE